MGGKMAQKYNNGNDFWSDFEQTETPDDGFDYRNPVGE